MPLTGGCLVARRWLYLHTYRLDRGKRDEREIERKLRMAKREKREGAQPAGESAITEITPEERNEADPDLALEEAVATIAKLKAEVARLEEKATRHALEAEYGFSEGRLMHGGVEYLVAEVDTAAELIDKVRKSFVEQDAVVAVLRRA